MGSDIYVAASGATARLRDLEVVSNNLANADTIGFKRNRAQFRTALESLLQERDGSRIGGAAGRAYVGLRSPGPDFAQGPTTDTGAPLDVAIRGEGFFAVETPQGPRYTRAGSFQVASDGKLVDREGRPVLGRSGPLRVGGSPVEILASGEIVDDRGLPRGRLAVFRFEDPGVLVKEGLAIFRADGVEPEAARDAELAPRSLERSNVKAVEELARLIVLQRAFDASMQTLRRQDESIERLLQEVRS
ncbi:MAG: flagellar basal-body rod protein FlgF [Myxococcota bacterium]|nr:flagellar basal-body rod protein FlgF [Myxococcota bacterium]